MTDAAPTNLSGNQRRKLRSAARFFAVQALFQMEATGQTADQIIREFADYRFGGDEIAGLFRKAATQLPTAPGIQ